MYSFLYDLLMRINPQNMVLVFKYMGYFLMYLSVLYIFHTSNFIHPFQQSCNRYSFEIKNEIHSPYDRVDKRASISLDPKTLAEEENTNLNHIVFGIAGSKKFWSRRKKYIKLWWRRNQMRGYVWLDKQIRYSKEDENSLPPMKISSNTSRFQYNHNGGNPSAIRISRIVSENFRLGLEGVRWFVMGDDDTYFFAENLVRVLKKYDHNQYYYIGATSESHVQNLLFSYNMAYGGGGFAISYALAKALEKIQDECIERYPGLFGSDDRIQACMAELGVPLTKESGFHQLDVYGHAFGLLSAHPLSPIVSLHHLDLIQPIFPNMNQVEALNLLKIPETLDSSGLVQQSMCYDEPRNLTVSISWGYAVHILTGTYHRARDIELPPRTFYNWVTQTDFTGFAFKTRPYEMTRCDRPYVYMLSKASYDTLANHTVSEYVKYSKYRDARCKGKVNRTFGIERIVVLKKPDPHLWDKAPRRNCCKILPSKENGTMLIHVNGCKKGEIIASS